ncbi:unnamed protein product [Symbiodinium natans]|uniref:DUF1761 domain-containing protein n=1 Tax=Symbiodinium natans TaxID=878477 RepID=A0A812T5Q1_9DINO|nr:unnamed protein product [Symbiodinium natans]
MANIFAVVLAASSSFMVGGLWYSPAMFLTPWLQAMGDRRQAGGGHSSGTFAAAFAFSLISALVLSNLIGPKPTLSHALGLSLKVGLGLVATSFGINYQFAARPVTALLIDGGYHTVQFLLFGLVLGLWH